MPPSALENEIYNFILNLKHRIKNNDRGVITGLLLSSIPVFPIPIFGMIIGIANLILWKKKKIPLHEGRLIKFGIAIALVSALASILITLLALSLITNYTNINQIINEIGNLVATKFHINQYRT